MIRERLAGRSLARKRRHGRGCVLGGRGHFGRKFVFGRRGLQLLERQFKLIDQPRGALRSLPVTVTVQLGDLQLLLRDQRLVVGGPGFGEGCIRLRGNPFSRAR